MNTPLTPESTDQEAARIKPVQRLISAPPRHWVGDGFPVHGMIDYGPGASERSPFLMLDYAAPLDFPVNPPPARARGVGEHPHRGFETVTIVYDGAVSHRDSAGGGGTIGPGDVQWMTAGSGLVHDEFHAPHYSQSGGPFHMVQLWVNLPAAHKMTAPRYQAITQEAIKQVRLPHGAGVVRVIAGDYTHDGAHATAAAKTFTPMQVWDVQLAAGQSVDWTLPAAWHAIALVQAGTLQVLAEDGQVSQTAGAAQMLQWTRTGQRVRMQAHDDAASGTCRFLWLAGEPIDEPIVGHGPFVMNSRAEIVQAFHDYQAGTFGSVTVAG